MPSLTFCNTYLNTARPKLTVKLWQIIIGIMDCVYEGYGGPLDDIVQSLKSWTNLVCGRTITFVLNVTFMVVLFQAKDTVQKICLRLEVVLSMFNIF